MIFRSVINYLPLLVVSAIAAAPYTLPSHRHFRRWEALPVKKSGLLSGGKPRCGTNLTLNCSTR